MARVGGGRENTFAHPHPHRDAPAQAWMAVTGDVASVFFATTHEGSMVVGIGVRSGVNFVGIDE